MLLPAALPGLELIYPDATWTTATPEAMGMSSSGLQTAFNAIGADRGNTVVVRYGRHVWTDGDASTRHTVKSVSKSIVAMIAARVMHAHGVGIDDTIPLSNDPVQAGIEWGTSIFNSGYVGGELCTYRQFMSMTSDFGLDPHLPGQQHAYNNNAVHFYAMHMNRTWFGNVSPSALLERALFDHLGGHQDRISFGGMYSGWGDGWTLSARDMARLGLLLLGRGTWDTTRLLPADWCDALYLNQIPDDSVPNRDKDGSSWNETGSTDALKGAYSYGFWLLDDPDAFTAWGRGGNYIIVDRRNGLVIAVANFEPDTRPLPGRYLEEIRKAITDASGQAPTVATPASATPDPVTGTTTTVSVLGADDGGEAALTYTWTTTGTPPAPVSFSPTATHAAQNATATFTAAGSYQLQVDIRDADGLSTSSSVTVDVLQDPSAISIGSP